QIHGGASDQSARGRARLDARAHPYPLVAGMVASIDFLAGLDDTASGSRRERLLAAIAAALHHTSDLLATLPSELRAMRHVMLIGDAKRRIPALAFTVVVRKESEVVERLASRGICAFADEGTTGLFAALGVGEVGGAVRIGLAHYTNRCEVNQLVRALYELA